MIAATFPTLKDEPDTVADFLNDHGLHPELLRFAAEAVCKVVHRENVNLDISDLVLGCRNNEAFRALAESGADFGIFQHRSKGGKACITNSESSLLIMVHNTDAATGLGAHAPAFASKRSRRGTSYAHNESQDEFDLAGEVIEFNGNSVEMSQTTIDVCIFADKTDGKIVCRIELLVDAEMNATGSAFTACQQRFGMKFDADDFVANDVIQDANDDDFDDVIRPIHAQ